MLKHRITAVLVLLCLAVLSPAYAQPKPKRGSRAVTRLAKIDQYGNTAYTDQSTTWTAPLIVENRSSDPSSGTSGRVFINTTSHLLKYDSGSAIVPFGNITGTLTSGRISIASGSSSLTDDANFTFDTTTHTLALGGSNETLFTFNAGTMANTDIAANFTGTLGNGSNVGIKVNYQVGGSSGNPHGMHVYLDQSGAYTGTGQIVSLYGDMQGTSTGTDLQLASNGLVKGNIAIHGDAAGSTSGNNIGISARAVAGSGLNIAVIGKAVSASCTANVGILGSVSSSATNYCAGYFTLDNSNPTFPTAALACDNGPMGKDIFVARESGTPVFLIGTTGSITQTMTASIPVGGFAYSLTASLASGSGNHIGTNVSITPAGSTGNVYASKIILNSGWNGPAFSEGLQVDNNASGTGHDMQPASTGIGGNAGILIRGQGTTSTGYNFGVVGEVQGSSTTNIAVYGKSMDSGGTNGVGVIGLAQSGPTNIVGGYFGFNVTDPTFASAALIADNKGATSNPVALFRVNGTTQVSITSAGNLDLNENQLLHAKVENLSSDPSAGNSGRVFINTTSHTFKGDTGSSIVSLSGSGGSGPDIGTMVLATSAPTSDYKAANGQALSQSTYATLYSQLGITPSFTVDLRTVQPTALTAIASGLGIYVGVGSGSSNVWVSTDLVNWNAANTAGITGNFTDIVYFSGASMFVACNGTSNAYTSTDGYNWKVSQVFADATINFLAASGSTVLAVGASDTDSLSTPVQRIFTSTDGVSWTARSSALTGKTFTAVHYAGALSSPIFVIGCSDGSIETSTDATTWTSRTSNDAGQINAFASSSSLIVAAGASGGCSSPTGTIWTSRTVGTVNGLAYLSSATMPWVAVGTNQVHVSSDGLTWRQLTGVLSGKQAISYSSTDSKYVMACNGVVSGSSLSNLVTLGLPENNTESGTCSPTSTYVCLRNAPPTSSKIDISSDSGSTWQLNAFGAATFLYVAYGAGSANLYVGVGTGGQIATSTDASSGSWTTRTSGVSANLQTVAFKASSDLFVAVGASGAITHSTDGLTWTTASTTATSQQLNGVAWNGTTWCAVGNGGAVVTSTDAATWTKQNITAFGSNTINWITSDGTNFYAVTDGKTVFISSDGTSWSGYGCPITLLSLAWLNSQLVGYSSSGDIATSSDGKVWTVVQCGRSNVTFQKAYTLNSTFVLTDGTAGLMTSTSGVTFTGLRSTTMNGVTFCTTNTKCVAVGAAGNIMTSTTSGVTWTANYYASGAGAAALNDVAYSSDLDMFCTVGANGQIFTSTDNAVTWTQRSFSSIHFGDTPAGSFNSIVWSHDKLLWVACGAGGVIATSSNGTTWTERTSGVGVTLNQVCYNSSLTLFVIGGAGGVFLSSSNGTTWTLHNTSSQSSSVVGVASLEANGFYAVGTSAAWYSTDGLTWNPSLVRATATPSRIYYSSVEGGVLIPTTGGATAGSGTLIFTKDGISSTSSSFLQGAALLFPFAYDSTNDKYVGVSGGGGTPSSSWAVTLTRTYTKSTQFALPVIPNTFIKVR